MLQKLTYWWYTLINMTKKRIHNPKTGQYLSIRQRTTSQGRKGQILGAYSPETSKTITKNFGRALKKLSTK